MSVVCPQTYILVHEKLSARQRNCIMLRRGEKLVYLSLLGMAESCSSLLRASWKELKRIVQTELTSGAGEHDEYIASVVVPLVKAESKQIKAPT